jgi:hypothetical protein
MMAGLAVLVEQYLGKQSRAAVSACFQKVVLLSSFCRRSITMHLNHGLAMPAFRHASFELASSEQQGQQEKGSSVCLAAAGCGRTAVVVHACVDT